MRIKEIISYSKKIKLKTSYSISYKTIEDVEIVFLEIHLENGITGFGASNPSFQVVGETSDETLKNSKSQFFEELKGQDIREFNRIIEDSKKMFPSKPGTHCLIDLALHDAYCKFIGISVVNYYGCRHTKLPTSVTIGILDTAETVSMAKDFIKQGFQILKIKTGIKIEEDIERIAKLREIDKNLVIRVDANQGYNFSETVEFFEKTKDLNVEIVEQPMKTGLDHELKELNPKWRKILVADESLVSEKNAISLASDDPIFNIYNIKLMKCGGLKSAKNIAKIAENFSIDLFWGCNDESQISIIAALHIAFSCPNTKYLDLDGSLDLTEDVINNGFSLESGMLSIDNSKPGLGI